LQRDEFPGTLCKAIEEKSCCSHRSRLFCSEQTEDSAVGADVRKTSCDLFLQVLLQTPQMIKMSKHMLRETEGSKRKYGLFFARDFQTTLFFTKPLYISLAISIPPSAS